MNVKCFITIYLFVFCLSCCFNGNSISKNNNIYSVKNDGLWIYIETDIDGKIKNINIYDKHGRDIGVVFSDLGIEYYRLSDNISDYHMETDFSEQYFLHEKPIMPSSDTTPPVYNDDFLIAENAFFRYEKKGQKKMEYVIDYSHSPYFFFNMPEISEVQNE